MAKRITFVRRAWSAAEPSAVFALLADGASWPRWSPIDSFTLEREGTGGGESLGAVRVFKTGAMRSREELVEIRPDTSLSYVALSGLPLRGHRADVELAPHDGGTAISWHEGFEARFPGTGWWLRAVLQRFIQRCADGLAKAAAAEPTS